MGLLGPSGAGLFPCYDWWVLCGDVTMAISRRVGRPWLPTPSMAGESCQIQLSNVAGRIVLLGFDERGDAVCWVQWHQIYCGMINHEYILSWFIMVQRLAMFLSCTSKWHLKSDHDLLPEALFGSMRFGSIATKGWCLSWSLLEGVQLGWIKIQWDVNTGGWDIGKTTMRFEVASWNMMILVR